MMKLKAFRVTNFRSVEDSGWIETNDVTALIGVNESGKTNLLVPLWKFSPAKGGEINPIADYPRKRYGEIRAMGKKPKFIQTKFELDDELVQQLVKITGVSADAVRITSVDRDFSGTYYIGFPEDVPVRSRPKSEVEKLLSAALSDITNLGKAETEDGVKPKSEDALKNAALFALAEAQGVVKAAGELIAKGTLDKIKAAISKVELENPPKRSTVAPRLGEVSDSLDEMIASISKPYAQEFDEARRLVLNNLPSFVYYSNYGNLDSEIYLPHVIENMKRTDLGSKEEAKVRTLKVLFEFVNLSPQEILELGREHDVNQGEPTDDQIQAIAQKKKEREILLQSASTGLTDKFRSWWKQGNYRFRFQADGNHFRIWVSDDLRPEEIELEGRSTGLQWFFSFYLIFLVESQNSHEDAILLLDEPGLSLHPLAQKDLFEFFDNLSRTNQILYTTHSPFMVDSNHLDRVKAVYVNDGGATAVSANLRASEGNSAQTKSIYPVHAALGLSVSSVLFEGCQPVIVEGPADQHYMNAIKNYLIGRGAINPKRDILFVPAGGIRGISAVVSIVTGKKESLPFVVLDSDTPGRKLAQQLKSNLYSAEPDRVILTSDICGMNDSEVEDLFPYSFLADVISRYLRGQQEDFSEDSEGGKPVIPQVEEYAKNHDIQLIKGWKVEVAMRAKVRLLKGEDPLKDEDGVVENWRALFSRFES